MKKHFMAQYIDYVVVLLRVVKRGTNLYVQWQGSSMESRLCEADGPSNYLLLKQDIDEVFANVGDYIPNYQGLIKKPEL